MRIYYREFDTALNPIRNHYSSMAESNTIFTFPDTLGALFFGASLFTFVSTTKAIASSSTTKRRKVVAYSAVALLIALGTIFHVVDIKEYSMYLGRPYRRTDAFYVTVTTGHGHSAPVLCGIITLVTSWVAGKLLVLRAWTLLNRDRRVLITLGGLLGSMIIIQIVLGAIGFGLGVSVVYPTINLLLSLCVTVAIIYYYTEVLPAESKELAIGVGTAVDIFADSGILLSVAFLLQTVFMFAGVSVEPMYATLPHIQNIVSFTLIDRMVTQRNGLGQLKLVSEEDVSRSSKADPSTIV